MQKYLVVISIPGPRCTDYFVSCRIFVESRSTSAGGILDVQPNESFIISFLKWNA